MKAKLLYEIKFRDFHPAEVFPVDINGDKVMEFVWLESPGVFHSDVFDDTISKVEEWNKQIFCLTATNRYGEILWQVGKPCDRTAHFITHCADQMVFPFDIDRDGKLELLVLRKDLLQIYDADSGNLKTEKKLVKSTYDIVKATYKPDGSVRILLKNSERAYNPYYYANPTLILDENLKEVKDPIIVEGAGHSPRIYDINSDGIDEWLIGYSAFTLDGDLLWSLDRQREDLYNPVRQHVDQIIVGDINLDGSPEIFYCGSDCGYLADSNGNLLWKRLMAHPQHAIFGNFLPNRNDLQIVVHNAEMYRSPIHRSKAPLTALSANGDILWNKVIQDNWPLGKPLVTIRQPMHGPEAILKLPKGAPNGLDAIITDEWGWPQALGPNGDWCFEIPCPPSAKWPFAFPPRRRPDDFGYCYRTKITDFNNDSRCEILIHDRYHAWLFSPPLPSKDSL